MHESLNRFEIGKRTSVEILRFAQDDKLVASCRIWLMLFTGNADWDLAISSLGEQEEA